MGHVFRRAAQRGLSAALILTALTLWGCGGLGPGEPADVVASHMVGQVRLTAAAERTPGGLLQVALRAENLGDTTAVVDLLGGGCLVIPRGYQDQAYRRLRWAGEATKGECVLVPFRLVLAPQAVQVELRTFSADFGGRSLYVTGEVQSGLERAELAAGLVPP